MSEQKFVDASEPDVRQAEQHEQKGRSSDHVKPDQLGFEPTLWTHVVDPARSPDDNVRLPALDRLVRKYQRPLSTFLWVSFRKYGIGFQWIDSCLQDFLADKIVIGQLLSNADRTRGKFRNFLKTCLYNFAISQIRSGTKRPDRYPLEESESVNELPESVAPAEVVMVQTDIAWARALLADALRRTKRDCERKGQRIVWIIFKRRDLYPLLHGKQTETLEETAAAVLRLTGCRVSKNQVSDRQTTGERKMRRHRRDILSEYCRDAEEITEEEDRLVEVLVRALRTVRNRMSL
jgi:hypothetical protein